MSEFLVCLHYGMVSINKKTKLVANFGFLKLVFSSSDCQSCVYDLLLTLISVDQFEK